MSLDDIKRKRKEDEATRDKALEATKAELKKRNQQKVQSKLDTKKKAGGPKGGAQQKHVNMKTKGAGAGAAKNFKK